MNGNSACQIHSSDPEHLQREVVGLASHYGNYRADRGSASRAGIGRIQRGLDNRLRAIAGHRDPLRNLWPFVCLLTVAEKVVDVRDPNSGADVLVANMLKALAHVFEQTGLDFVRRREIRMSPFRAVRTVFAALPGEKRLSGSGRKDGDVCLCHRRSGAERLDIFRPEFGNRTLQSLRGHSADERHRGSAASNGCLVDDPGQVRDLCSTRKYWTGDTEACPIDLQPGLAQELFRNGLDASIVRAMDLRFREVRVRSLLLGKNTKRRLGPTDIARQ